MAFIAYLIIPYLDVGSSLWRDLRLGTRSEITFTTMVKNIDNLSTQIDAKSEALAQCYIFVKNNKEMFKQEYDKLPKQTKDQFKKSITIAYRGYRDNLSNPKSSNEDYLLLLSEFK